MNTQKLIIDDGLVRLDINGNGVLTFNPSDFNLYDRFLGFTKELPEIEKKYAADVESAEGEEEIKTLVGKELTRAREIDAEVKAKLSAVFGVGNDFDKLLGGVNIMALGSNGERIITNLLDALLPYVESGIKRYASNEVAAAKMNREKRRVAQKGVSSL